MNNRFPAIGRLSRRAALRSNDLATSFLDIVMSRLVLSAMLYTVQVSRAASTQARVNRPMNVNDFPLLQGFAPFFLAR